MSEATTAVQAKQAYEGMFLLDSSKFAADHDGVIASLLGLLAKVDAEVVSHRPWMDGKLAYEIAGHRKGLHYLVYFRLDPSKQTELGRICALSDLVLRHLVIRHEDILFDAMVQALESHDENAEEGAAGETPPAESDDTGDRPRRGRF